MTRRNTTNRTKYWQSQHIPGMSLLYADFSHHDYGPHTHDAIVVAMTEIGGAEIRSRNIAQKIGSSTLFVSNPEERQSARMGDSVRWRYRAFYLARPAVDDLTRRLGIADTPYFMRNMLEDHDLIERLGRLHRALETEHDDLLAHELSLDAFGELFARHASGAVQAKQPSGNSKIVSSLIELMRARYCENLRLDDLAQAEGLTQFQLIKMFKRSVGLTPHAYLVHVRLNAACGHLKRGHSLAESALAAGFCDQSALNKHFKRCYGITPLQFANAIRSI